MTDKTIAPERASELFEFDLPSEVLVVEVALGANPAASRHLRGRGVPVVVYPRTATGVLGSGAHAGYVCELAEEDALALGWTEDEVLFAAGARAGYQLDDGRPICGECLAACGEYEPDADADAAHGVCWSCAEMLRDGWRERQNQGADDAE